jgi:hypothetical protein
VHAPQKPPPQPNFVPVNLSRSRNTHNRGMSSGTLSSECRVSLTTISIMRCLLNVVVQRGALHEWMRDKGRVLAVIIESR